MILPGIDVRARVVPDGALIRLARDGAQAAVRIDITLKGSYRPSGSGIPARSRP